MMVSRGLLHVLVMVVMIIGDAHALWSSSSWLPTQRIVKLFEHNNKQEQLVLAKEHVRQVLSEENSLSHHASEYRSKGKFHSITKLFDTIGARWNPIFAQIIDTYLEKHPKAEIPKLSISKHMVQMRDGIHLSTIVVVPEFSDNERRKIPTMLSRSPYGPTSDMIALVYTILNGHAAIIQDQRGTFLSEGSFTLWQRDAEDGYDTMEWISNQPWSNKEIFMVGISADGCGALTEMRMPGVEKYLKGQMIILSNADGHETTYPGGSFREGLITGWMTVQSILTKGHSLSHTLPEILKNEMLGQFWTPIQAEAPGIDNYPNVKWPMIHYAGWADIFLGMQTDNFDKFVSKSDKSVRNHHKLVVGPLGHCIFGAEIHPDLMAAEVKGLINAVGFSSDLFREITDSGKMEPKADGSTIWGSKLKRINFYVHGPQKEWRKKSSSFLREEKPSTPAAMVENDAYGHYWTSLDNWPKFSNKKFFISANRELLEAPLPAGKLGAYGREQYVYDPANPVVTHGGNNFVLIFVGLGCGQMNQKHIESREDVLVFTTPAPLDAPLAIVGKIKAVLHVSSDRNDTDFFVSLTDVHPNGDSFQIASGLRRMKWRKSTIIESIESPNLKPEEVYEVEIDLWRTAHVFAPGHSVRIVISSSNTPYYAKNNDSGNKDEVLGILDIKKAQNKIHWSPDAPSYIQLPVVALKDIPRNENF